MHKKQEILEWAVIRGIMDKATDLTQFYKLQEEVTELKEAIINCDIPEQIDAIGDIYVVLTILTEKLGLDMQACINSAYEVISKRTGRMVDGVFVKDK